MKKYRAHIYNENCILYKYRGKTYRYFVDIYRTVWVKACSFFMSCKSFSVLSLVVDKEKKLLNYYKILYTPFFDKKTNKKNTLPKPATIFSFSYGHKSLQVCAFQAILKQLLSSICIFWNSFQALMKNPRTLLDFALSRNRSTDTELHAPIQSNGTRDQVKVPSCISST